MANFKAGNNNMQTLMRQAQKMQEEMEKTAELLDDWEVVGTAAGEAVVVYMNAKKIINGIELDESIVDPTDVEMLEDLIMAAINDGYAKADKVYEEKMGRYGDMGALGLALSLGFASGAMLYVVFGEIIPQAILMYQSKLPAFSVIVGMFVGLFIIYI